MVLISAGVSGVTKVDESSWGAIYTAEGKDGYQFVDNKLYKLIGYYTIGEATVGLYKETTPAIGTKVLAGTAVYTYTSGTAEWKNDTTAK